MNSLNQATIGQGLQCSLRDLPTLWLRRHATRHQLKLMLQQDPNRLHDDLGLTEFVVQQECKKWFWQE